MTIKIKKKETKDMTVHPAPKNFGVGKINLS